MKAEFEEKIINEAKTFFRECGQSMEESCMYWGIECGDGWFEPILLMAKKINAVNEYFGKQFNICAVAKQIKEKYSHLDVYWDLEPLDKNANVDYESENYKIMDSIIRDIVLSAENECELRCEICGAKETYNNKLIITKGWMTRKCKECFDKGN